MNKLAEPQLDTEVAFLLKQHRGKDNPIGRWDMVERIFGVGASYPRSDNNLYDRRIRDSVERQRPVLLICDLADGRGRYLANNYAEYREFRGKYVSRAYPIMKTAEAMDETAEREFREEYLEWKRNKEQPSLFAITGAAL